MITAVILVLYAAMILVTARWRYRVIRPYTEPLGCTTKPSCREKHRYPSCYRRYGQVDTTGEAVFIALLAGLIWPFIVPALLLRLLVTAGHRDLPEEVQAQIRRLEAESEQLRQEQEGTGS